MKRLLAALLLLALPAFAQDYPARSEGFRAAAERLNGVPSFTDGATLRARFAAEAAANQPLLRALGIARE